MKKLELKTLIQKVIQEEIKNNLTEFNKYDGDDDYLESQNSTFESEDGWSEEAFEEAGIMDVLREVERAIYEIKNARRGAYAGLGENQEEFIEGLGELGQQLFDVCNRALD